MPFGTSHLHDVQRRREIQLARGLRGHLCDESEVVIQRSKLLDANGRSNLLNAR